MIKCKFKVDSIKRRPSGDTENPEVHDVEMSAVYSDDPMSENGALINSFAAYRAVRENTRLNWWQQCVCAEATPTPLICPGTLPWR